MLFLMFFWNLGEKGVSSYKNLTKGKFVIAE